jgi:FixJ family two-component response regulator
MKTQSVTQEILLVEDDESLSGALDSLLKMSGYTVRTYASAEQMLAGLPDRPSPNRAQCVLMDVNLKGMNGVEAQKRMRETGCDLPVVFMSGDMDVHNVNQAWQNGAHNFLFKPFKPMELLKILEGVFAAPPPKQALSTEDDGRLLAQLHMLTTRQRQVLKWVATGQSNTLISSHMEISARTVKMHRAGIMHRLGFGHVADLVRFYERSQHLLDNGSESQQ